MKLEKLNDDNLIVFLNKFYVDKYKFSLIDDLEEYFRNMFKILGNYYNIDVKGYYDVTIYQDNIYGYILKINREDIDFYGYYDDHIDMKITILKNSKFIFKISDYSLIREDVLKYCYLGKYKGDLYLIPKKTINQYALGYIIENCKIIFGSDADEILSRYIQINTSKIFV